MEWFSDLPTCGRRCVLSVAVWGPTGLPPSPAASGSQLPGKLRETQALPFCPFRARGPRIPAPGHAWCRPGRAWLQSALDPPPSKSPLLPWRWVGGSGENKAELRALAHHDPAPPRNCEQSRPVGLLGHIFPVKQEARLAVTGRLTCSPSPRRRSHRLGHPDNGARVGGGGEGLLPTDWEPVSRV